MCGSEDSAQLLMETFCWAPQACRGQPEGLRQLSVLSGLPCSRPPPPGCLRCGSGAPMHTSGSLVCLSGGLDSDRTAPAAEQWCHLLFCGPWARRWWARYRQSCQAPGTGTWPGHSAHQRRLGVAAARLWTPDTAPAGRAAARVLRQTPTWHSLGPTARAVSHRPPGSQSGGVRITVLVSLQAPRLVS